MGRKQWLAVALVIGGGILLQIRGHQDAEMASMGHGEVPVEMADLQGPYRTVALAVTGMT